MIVDKENPQALADAIYKFYTEKKEQEYTENVQYELKKYSWANFAKGIFEMIDS